MARQVIGFVTQEVYPRKILFLHFYLIEKAQTIGVLEPLGVSCIQERIFLYADDVILFTSPNQQNLVATQNILEMFALASRLNINQNKCAIIPICCRLNETALFMQFLHGNI
jgi:hypothetical protein